MRVLPCGMLLALAVSAVAIASRLPDQPPVAGLEQRLAACRHLLADWAGLTRYGSEDSELGAPAPGESRVVFIGDEVTERWPFAETFPGKTYLNRGITRQASPQMLVRFRQDVIALHPKAVVIGAGLNDVAGLAGPGTRGTLADNIASMTELAKANGIKVVLASITPVCDCYGEQTAIRSQARIADFNAWLREYAAESGSIYLDYYSALADGRALRRELTADGLLPNSRGYALMASLAERAINAAIAK